MEELKALKEVYSNWHNILMTLTISLCAFSLIAAFMNLPLLWTSLWSNPLPTTVGLYFALVRGVTFGNPLYYVVVQALLTLLIGVSITLIIYKGSSLTSVANIEGMGATIFTVLSTGCSACGVGALSMLGIVGGLAVLPFNGMELWVAAIVLLLFSIRRTARAILNPHCAL